MRAAAWLALTAVLVIERAPAPPRIERVRAAYVSGLDSLAAALDALRATPAGSASHDAYRRARAAYKSVEGLLEYLDGMTATTLNGRDNEEAEGDADLDAAEGTPREPVTGFAALDTAYSAAEIERSSLFMARAVRTSASLARHIPIDDTRLFDAVRLEVARIATLGLGGLDATELGDRAPEAAAALRGLRSVMAIAFGDARGDLLAARRETDARFVAAIGLLEASDDVFAAIADGLYPLARAVNAERHARRVALPRTDGAWRASAAFIFDRNAFDPAAYAPGQVGDTSAALVALGKRLFFDPRLSGDKTRSCATCHQPDRAFTDGRARASTIEGAGHQLARNTPTLINAALQPAQLADLRVRSLEEQIVAVIGSASEMGGHVDTAAVRLALPRARIPAALAAYVRSLTAIDSRFDRAIRGDRAALTASERRGFNVFMGSGRCATCHFAPLFGGTMPPEYWATPPEVIGVPVSRADSTIDSDLGRGGVDGQASHRHSFKTPSLRNVALTAPYMHNGAFRTLEDVIDFYERGGAAGLGIHLPNQTLPRAKLGLTDRDRTDLVAFLGALTDTLITVAR